MSRARTAIAAAAAALLVAACASAPPRPHRAKSHHRGGYYENDGPPKNAAIDISRIPDAVPHKEPRSPYGNPDSYRALGHTYDVLKSAAGFTQTGMASWYGRQFAGRRTSSGEPYSMFKMTAAHKRLPIPCYVRVTNLDNGRHVIVRINDRGPFRKNRIIDLSYVAARRLGLVATGSAPVRIRTVTPKTMRAKQDSDDRPRASPPSPRRAPGPGSAANARPTGAKPPASADADAAGRGGLFLQTGAFGRPANARRLRARLKADGIAGVTILKPSAATPLYRVRVGPFADPGRRTSVRRMLAARGFAARAVAR